MWAVSGIKFQGSSKLSEVVDVFRNRMLRRIFFGVLLGYGLLKTGKIRTEVF